MNRPVLLHRQRCQRDRRRRVLSSAGRVAFVLLVTTAVCFLLYVSYVLTPCR